MPQITTMTEIPKHLLVDSDGMDTYDYLVNHIARLDGDISPYIENIHRVDRTGQFLASTARFLAAVNQSYFENEIGQLIEYAIEKDRDRKYIGSLLQAIWGDNYEDRAEELCMCDDNFRRIYRRIYHTGL